MNILKNAKINKKTVNSITAFLVVIFIIGTIMIPQTKAMDYDFEIWEDYWPDDIADNKPATGTNGYICFMAS